MVSGPPRLSLAVLVDGSSLEQFSHELGKDISEFVGLPADVVEVSTATEFERHVTAGPRVLRVSPSFDEGEWKALDRARSRLEPRAAVVLVVDQATAGHLGAWAPNLASWLATSVYRAKATDAMSEVERSDRLNEFQRKYGITNEQAIERAERRQPPSEEPDFSVWLVLLGRPELISEATR